MPNFYENCLGLLPICNFYMVHSLWLCVVMCSQSYSPIVAILSLAVNYYSFVRSHCNSVAFLFLLAKCSS